MGGYSTISPSSVLVWYADDISKLVNLTHLCLMECPTLINWTSPFPFKGCWVLFFIFHSNLKANSGYPGQTPRSVASDLDLHCPPKSHKKDDRLICVNYVWERRPDTI